MRKYSLLISILIIAGLTVAGGIFINSRYHFISALNRIPSEKGIYYCPMHPNFTSDKPGNCPICGMSLVKKETSQSEAANSASQGNLRKILYYRNPMNPQMTSPVPMKDNMGMDYIPVYANEESLKMNQGVYINPQKQQLIGIKTGKVEKRRLSGQINTVGIAAYDPDLFVAQQEFLLAVKSAAGTSNNSVSTLRQQNENMVNTSKRKLLLMGMSQDEITTLIAAGTPDQSLYLPEGERIWIYLSVYQYESQFVKTGLPVEIETSAYPGQTFKGRIISIAPLLDISTISFKVRVLAENPENKLRMQTYVNAKIQYDLGEKLSVPQEAVMDSGLKKYVFVAKLDGYFETRNIEVGAKAEGFYEVLRGLAEGEIVTVSANFLIDSESKLNAILNQMSEQNQPQ
jgi:membrane fusion protein, copper/silver efflux system